MLRKNPFALVKCDLKIQEFPLRASAHVFYVDTGGTFEF